MMNYSISDITQSADHYKLFVITCNEDDLLQCISWVQSLEMNVLNIGKELAGFIEGMEDLSYLSIDAVDFLKRILDKHKSKINGTGNDVLAIYNLGMLLEPTIELNAVQLLREFSKTAALVIIWENQSDAPDRLNWSTQQNNVFLDFSETQIKNLKYAI